MNPLDLSGILNPYPVAEFLTGYFGTSILHATGLPHRFEPLLIGEAVAAGLTKKLDEQHPPVMALARRLERSLEAPVRADLWTDADGFAARCEQQDILVLQIAGRSPWEVHARAADPNEDPAGDPIWRGLLEAGDTLYIPRGFWHAATPAGNQATQVAIYIENPTGGELLDWFVRHLKRQKCFQADVPRFAGPGERADYLTALRRTMGQAWRTPGLLELFARNRRAHAVPRPPAGPTPSPASLPPESIIAIAVPRGLTLLRADEHTLFLKHHGESLLFPEDAAPLIQFLNDHAPVSVAQFQDAMAAEFDPEEISEFLSVLSSSGIVAFHAPGSIC